jgi:toxin ParE1/3/4
VKLIWSRRAIGDLRALRAYIENENPAAARKMTLRIVEFVETMIAENPAVGRPGRVPGTRELVVTHTPYIVPYRLRHGAIEILRVYHGARRWPDRL